MINIVGNTNELISTLWTALRESGIDFFDQAGFYGFILRLARMSPSEYGFALPAADHIEKQMSLDKRLSIWEPSVYLVKNDGDSMQDAGVVSASTCCRCPVFTCAKWGGRRVGVCRKISDRGLFSKNP